MIWIKIVIDLLTHKDTNGNTVTHIMVVFNNMKMFDMAVECGATINTTNNLVSFLNNSKT